jgi:UDP-galactopyranose mutase
MILKVDNVSIRYLIGDFKDIGIKEYVMRRLTRNYRVREFWAVDGVSFTLEKGDMLGIVGVNGAGKSTLLKAVAGIMEPTRGSVTRNGSVSALLELASGFDAELTVKENAYLRGAMLGYTRKFMDEAYGSIISFAELEDYQDRPFKQLSTGMKARLAFSIASLINPEILILDEVLSVGDGAFRKKSAAKMNEILKGGATTILVSHSLEQIRELCNKALWMDHGKQIAFGDAQSICDQYQNHLSHEANISISVSSGQAQKTKSRKAYDYLIVGAGLYGAVFAHEMVKNGKKCLVIDRRPHIGGNVYTEQVSGINVHKYGPHIFHTDNADVWNYINRFAEFRPFINAPLAVYGKELYNLPFNMNTFHQMWGVRTPSEAREKIRSQIAGLNIGEPSNLEEQALLMVGYDIYEKLIKGYTEKQWGKRCAELPANLIRRIPLRFIYDNNYYNDRYQGIPIGGYTQIIEKLLAGSDVMLGTQYADFIRTNPDIAEKIVYTGPIDEYFGYSLGALEYRSLRFETEEIQAEDYQGNAVVNYTSPDIPYTRIIEHKHFEPVNQPSTIISREYPLKWKPGEEPYYPVNDDRNNELYTEYAKLAAAEQNVLFGGRLGLYQYLDMDKTIIAALSAAGKELTEPVSG